MGRLTCFGAFLFLLAANSAFASFFSHLNAQDKWTIQNGDQVIQYEPVNDAIWPKCSGYQRVNATAEEAAAVLFDYERQSEFVHRVLDVQVTPTGDPKTSIVRYKMDVPSIISYWFDPNYTVESTVSYLGQNSGYQLAVKLTESRDLANVEGYIYFEPMSGGGTLMYGTTHIEPKNPGYLLSTKPVLAVVKRSGMRALQSIVNRIHDVKKNHPDLLVQEVEKLRKALN